MQTLELISLFVRRHMQNCSDGMGIMCGKLRIDPIRQAQQFAGVGDIADIRCRFLGKDRKAIDPFNLRALDLSIPISPFHQPHHDAPIIAGGHVVKLVNHPASTRPIGLHHNAKAIPLSQSRF